MDTPVRDRVDVDDATSQITVPHWGITLRTLFGAALESWPNPQPGERRDYTVLHKDKPIAVIHVQQHNPLI